MRVGRYVREGALRPFLLAPSGKGLDWDVFDQDAVPKSVREMIRSALQIGSDADFLAALPLLEEYVASNPDYLQAVDSASDSLMVARLPPPVHPLNFICIGLNYVDHARESKMDLPAQPLLFAKTANAITGHGHSVQIPRGSEQLDYEAELAVVIGRRCHRVSASEALDCVAGYTCANDISARDFQFTDGQWFRGKSCDGFGPLGPWLVTKSEIHDARALSIRLRLNGQTMQDSTTANLIFGVPELVEFVSSFITLEPGDVISTGTPPGVGFARKPPVYLHAGDVVEVDVDKIGVLRNTIGGKQ